MHFGMQGLPPYTTLYSDWRDVTKSRFILFFIVLSRTSGVLVVDFCLGGVRGSFGLAVSSNTTRNRNTSLDNII